jgi:hypothetical protein
LQQARQLLALAWRKTREDLLLGALRLGAGLLVQHSPCGGGDDHVRPPVSRIGFSGDEPARLQIVDECHDLTGIETKEIGQITLGRT